MGEQCAQCCYPGRPAEWTRQVLKGARDTDSQSRCALPAELTRAGCSAGPPTVHAARRGKGRGRGRRIDHFSMEKTSADMATTNIGQDGDEKVDEDILLLVETAIAAAQSIAYNDAAGPGRLQEAIDTIFEAEKKARLAGELSPTRKACLAILDLCDELKDWTALNQNMLIISKRRAQLKQVIKECVEKAMVFLDKETDVDKRLELLDTLRSVTEGKIFVEMERARLTRSLVAIKEDQGQTEEACNLLQEVQVETIGEMSKREKTAYILDQMRLCLAKGDIVRTAIISKKVNPKVFADSTLQDLKVRYYDLMIQKETQDKAYLEIAKSYYAIFDTPSVQKDLPEFQHEYSGQWAEALKCVAIFLILAPHNNEQSDFINRIAGHKQLDDVPAFKSLVKRFVTDEIFKMADLTAAYQADMAAVGAAFPADKSELAKERWKVRLCLCLSLCLCRVLAAVTAQPLASRELALTVCLLCRCVLGCCVSQDVDTRVVEHNIRVVAKCYSRIRSDRLANLLGKSPDETEENLARLVVDKSVCVSLSLSISLWPPWLPMPTALPGLLLVATDRHARGFYATGTQRLTGRTKWCPSGRRRTRAASSTRGRATYLGCYRWWSSPAT